MTTTSPKLTHQSSIQAVFDAQRRHAPHMALTTAKERLERIGRIHRWIQDHEADLMQAMHADFRKPAAEALLGDLGALYYEIRHTTKHLSRWMKPHRVPTPLPLLGTRGYVRYEPKGNVLIIAPWNYPFGLCIKPLVAAISTGNVVMLKPSEMTPNTTRTIKRMVEELFPPEEVAVFEGDAAVATQLLDLPFNHIFFTGSPAVGKIVMTAAAKHLASVTLELGGKSPVIVDETANIKAAAEQIAWGKYFNNGQTCIAPDYLLVHESVKEPFLRAFRESVQRMYNPAGQPTEQSESYCRIVNKNHFGRVRRLIEDAVQKGATVTLGGQLNEADNFIAPTVIEGVTDQMALMQEEIFGPVLPVVPYQTADEALQVINSREKPLALYIQSGSRRNIDYIMQRTSAGDTVINDLFWQFGHMDLPFGGVNNSGIGKSNGFFGFQELSNMRGVMKRDFGTARFIYPPYTDKIEKLIGFLVKKL
ncbi:aldehyde dehydrogenase family protein [Rudanella lutea]|uniref:aldehyde dehydrogenase family protein n=1 Tax=Rudanella lutea TaxID=451374 RepID=UPI00035F751D|nr:aldehyde dehydrogenase family protein [Rudanella lutea]